MSYKYYIGVVFAYEGDGFWNRDGDYIDRPIYEQPEQVYFDTIQEFFNKIVLVHPKDSSAKGERINLTFRTIY